jgi:hypothetical protein
MSVAVSVVLALMLPSAGEELTRIKIGLLNLENAGQKPQVAVQATEKLQQLIATQGMVEVYTEAMIEKALAKVGRKMPARCRDPRCVLDLGGMINMDRMIFGTVDADDKRTGLHLYLLDIVMRQQIGEASVEANRDVPLDTVLATAFARIHGRSSEKAEIKKYFGPEVHHEKQAMITTGSFLAAGVIWGLVNYSVGNKGTPLDFENRTEELTGIPSSADQIPMFARPAALANAYVAASDDAYGVLYNPAGVAWVNFPEAIVGYQYRFGLNNIAASYVNKATREIGFGTAVLYSGDQDALLSEIYFVTSAAYKFNRILSFVRPISLGLSLKTSSHRLRAGSGGQYGDFSVGGASFGVNLDCGLIAELSEQIRYGLLVRDVPLVNQWKNTTLGDSYSEAPATTLHMGGTYQAGYTTFLVCEGQIPLYPDQPWKMAGGIEQEMFRVFMARVGLQKQIQSAAGASTPWKVTCGFGLNTEKFSLDGSYEYNTLGMFDVLNISLRKGF